MLTLSKTTFYKILCVVIGLACFICPEVTIGGSYSSRTIDTKGTPLKGSVVDSNGTDIAIMQFFGEGTNVISFDKEQNLITKDPNGNVIAGFEITAIDPNHKKPTALYILNYEEDGKTRAILFEHKFAKTVFRKGKLSMEKADEKMFTSYRVDGVRLTVVFKGIKNETDQKGEIINKIIFASPKGEEFVFRISPRNRISILSQIKGDIISYFKKTEKDIKK